MSHKYRKVVKRCPRCRNLFVLGLNGARYPQSTAILCDPCAGVEQDKKGYAWHPWKTQASFVNVDDPIENAYVITRAEAFGVTR